MTITNGGQDTDRLVTATSPLASTVMLHQMQLQNGVAAMRMVDAIEIPAGGTVTLAPGGFHIMFIGVTKPLKEGDEMPVTLTFAHVGTGRDLPPRPGGRGRAGREPGRRALPRCRARPCAPCASRPGRDRRRRRLLDRTFVAPRGQNPTTPLVASTIGGPFSLVDQHGATVTEAALKGHPSALFFGYTYCPDVCPTTLADMIGLAQGARARRRQAQGLFRHVDPERDTTERDRRLSAGLRPAHRRAHRLAAAIDKISRPTGSTCARSGRGRRLHHGPHRLGAISSMRSTFVGTVDYEEEPVTALAKLKRLVGA